MTTSRSARRYGAVSLFDVSCLDDLYPLESPQVERRSLGSFFFYFLLFIAPYRFIITATADFTPMSLFFWVTIPGGVREHSLSECNTVCTNVRGPPGTTDFFYENSRGFPATPRSAAENAAAALAIPSATDVVGLLGGKRSSFPNAGDFRWTVGPYSGTRFYPSGSYHNFGSGEPSGAYWSPSCPKENYVVTHSHSPHNDNAGQWNDACDYNIETTGCLCQGLLGPTATLSTSLSLTQGVPSTSMSTNLTTSVTASRSASITASTSATHSTTFMQTSSGSHTRSSSVPTNSFSGTRESSVSHSISVSVSQILSPTKNSATNTQPSSLSSSFTAIFTQSMTDDSSTSQSIMTSSPSHSQSLQKSNTSSLFVTDTKTVSMTANSDTIACSPPIIQLNASIDSAIPVGGDNAIEESAVKIEKNSSVVIVHRSDFMYKRCLILQVEQLHPISQGGDELDTADIPIVTGPLAAEFDNISWSVMDVPVSDESAIRKRIGVAKLCTTSFNMHGKQHFQMLGVLSGSVQASLRIPLRCRQVLSSYSSIIDIVFMASLPSSSDTVAIQRAIHTPLTLNANSIARRGLPTLQRLGGGGCTGDPADSLWELNMGKEQWALYGGSVLGNIAIVIVAWTGFGLLAMIWWSCWNCKELHTTDTASESPIATVMAAVWTAFRSVHMASLWLPIFGVVIVPVTTNAVALTFMWINEDSNTASWRLTGVFALLVGVWTLVVMLWVGQTAKRRLIIDTTIRQQLFNNQQASWYERLTRRFKWRAQNDDKRSISFKRHAQLALDEATSWWYIPFDTLLAVVVAVTDGSGKALGGGNRAACWVSLCIGPLTQLLLLLVVLRWTPHGDLFTHWIAVLASLLCFAAGVLQLLLAMIQVDFFDVPSGVEKSMLIVLSALLLVAAGVSWMRYVANFVSVLVWIFGNMTGRSKYGAARNATVSTSQRPHKIKPHSIGRRVPSYSITLSENELREAYPSPLCFEATVPIVLQKVPSTSSLSNSTNLTLAKITEDHDSFLCLPFSSPFEVTMLRPQENCSDDDSIDDVILTFPPYVTNERASSISESKSVNEQLKGIPTVGFKGGTSNPLATAYGGQIEMRRQNQSYLLL